MKRNLSQPGFVILFAILISAIILLISFGIFSIATRETVLSGTSREAQAAFYAADAGVECALYAQSLGASGPFATGGGSFPCGALGTVQMTPGSGAQPYEFYVLVDQNLKTCAHVSIFDTNAGASRRVVSQGYNICNTTTVMPATNNPVLVERVLDIIYQIGSTVPTGTGGVPSGGLEINGFEPPVGIEPSDSGSSSTSDGLVVPGGN